MISAELLGTALEAVGRRPNDQQAVAVEAPRNDALFVVAGPGTGKTATLTMRMLKLVFVDQVEPRGILATTFTKKAAEELRSRVLSWGYGVQEYLLEHGNLDRLDEMWVNKVDINQIRTGTVDSLCEELLRDFRDPGTDPPILADEFVAKTLLLRDGMFADGARRDQDPDLSVLLAGQCGKLRNDGEPYLNFSVAEKTNLVRTLWDRRHHDQIGWSGFATSGANTEEANARSALTAAMDSYHDALQQRLMVDFAQLEQTVLERLHAGGFQEFTDELEVVMVDEYQDTNLLQESLYFELAKHCDGALTVVGDDDQSLYRFRGATVELFSDFENRFQTVGGFSKKPTKVFLNANYRSTKAIIDFVNEYATLDTSYQSVRVAGKPPLVNPVGGDGANDYPIIGLFRDNLDDLSVDLTAFIHSVTRGSGYRLPSGQLLQIDGAQGGNVGDCALLCSSPKELNASGDPRLPRCLKDELHRQASPIAVFNPRGQDFASIPIVQLLAGLLMCCLDRYGDAATKVVRAVGQDTVNRFTAWATHAEDWLASDQAPDELVDYVDHWEERKPAHAGLAWPKYISCIELLYDLVHWLPDLQDDAEGQVYLEVFTRQLGAAEQVSGFRAQVIHDPGDEALSLSSVGHLLMYFLAPIASGSASVDEELMDTFPRDRLSVLSIHQSKGLEFPLTIVDVGADYRREHWKNAFKRFPRSPGTPQNLEDLLRPYSPLKTLARNPVDRSFDDLFRQYFVAFSRPQDVLVLVGLNGSHPDRGAIRNVATGWDRDEANHWTGNVPFVDI